MSEKSNVRTSGVRYSDVNCTFLTLQYVQLIPHAVVKSVLVENDLCVYCCCAKQKASTYTVGMFFLFLLMYKVGIPTTELSGIQMVENSRIEYQTKSPLFEWLQVVYIVILQQQYQSFSSISLSTTQHITPKHYYAIKTCTQTGSPNPKTILTNNKLMDEKD